MENKTNEITFKLSIEQISELNSLVRNLRFSIDEIKAIELSNNTPDSKKGFMLGCSYSKISQIHKDMEDLIGDIRK